MISFKDFLLETKTQAQIERLKITPEQISKDLENGDYETREIAIRHPNATPEHINQALNDEAFKVRRAARFRLNKSNRNNDGI
jgi:hypothetical protein